jgi:hypothetical protein
MNDEQHTICKKYNSEYIYFNPLINVGANIASLDKQPIYGVRINPTTDTSGWYFWGGDYSDADDFFQPVHGKHIVELHPELEKYLALQAGFKFIVDNEGYEDVWYDPSSISRAGQNPSDS